MPTRTARALLALVTCLALTALGLAGLTARAAATAPTAATRSAPASVTHPRPGNPAPSYNGLALTPPMGWNDWSYFQCNIDEKLIVAQAKALVSTGLAKAGYDTVTTDDCWMAKTRAADGSLQADPVKFPHGMAWLGRQIHALGLKYGIYEDSGTQTCGGYPGSFGHYTQDANTFAKWKVDYVKLDGCNVASVPGQRDVDTYKMLYDEFSAALLATGRPMVFSNSTPAYFQGGPDWFESIENSTKNSNLWREGSDVVLGQGEHKWSSVFGNYSYNVPLGRYAGPGHWNDPDFLIVGDSGLTTAEQQSQMSLWAEMAAPLISSTDLTKLSPTALKILSNKAIIAVDQDRAGVQGHIAARGSGYQVLAKPLTGGDVSVVLFNTSDRARTIATAGQTIGLSSGGPYRLTDLVTGRKTATSGVIAANVAPHGTVMYRVHPYASGALPPAVSLTLGGKAPGAGGPKPVTVTMTNNGPTAVRSADVSLTVPTGWTVQPKRQHFGAIRPGASATATFEVTGTKPGPGLSSKALTATVSYTSAAGSSKVTGEYDVVTNIPFASLAGTFNNVGATTLATRATGNFDSDGNSFSSEQLAKAGVKPGGTLKADGATFTWPTQAGTGKPDNAVGTGAKVRFSGHGSRLVFLGSAAGDETDQVTVTYTDGTSSTGSFGFPNWSFSDPTEFNSKLAVSTMGRNTQAGYADSQYAYRLFTNSVAITPSKTIATVTLPTSGAIHIFAIATSTTST